jgi:type I restriction enzyme, S subunit
VPNLKECRVRFPPLPEQTIITARLAALQTETRRLEALYARKLAALDELKTSLLHQAFSGEL